MKKEKTLTHFSLCTGIGGIDLAAEWAGFKTIGQCEIDEYASKVLAKNFKGVPNFGDVRTITAERLRGEGIGPEGITVLSAGFPCQPYSLAGKGLGDSDSRDLWGEVARVLGELKPRWFVGENTPGLFARANQRYFYRVLTDLAALGYSVGWGIWGAVDVGAPHKRERVFICGHRNAEVCGKFSNAAFKRSDTHKIQRGKPVESGTAANKGRIQIGGVQPGGICGGISEFFNKRKGAEANPWKTEPDVGRVADGVSYMVDRLKCLGNAVVPQQVYPLFEAIAETERRYYDDDF